MLKKGLIKLRTNWWIWLNFWLMAAVSKIQLKHLIKRIHPLNRSFYPKMGCPTWMAAVQLYCDSTVLPLKKAAIIHDPDYNYQPTKPRECHCRNNIQDIIFDLVWCIIWKANHRLKSSRSLIFCSLFKLKQNDPQVWRWKQWLTCFFTFLPCFLASAAPFCQKGTTSKQPRQAAQECGKVPRAAFANILKAVPGL